MAIEDAINALPEHWDDVLSQLGQSRAAALTALVVRLGRDDDPQVPTRIAQLLVDGLPPRHPVRRALAGGRLLESSPIDARGIARLHDRLHDRLTPSVTPGLPGDLPGTSDLVGGEPPTTAEILRAVTDRLLAAPAYSEREVRQHGADPEDPVLIRLRRPGGGRQWPAFQFASGQAGLFPVVRTINTLLGAATDPIGVADWWLSRNGWLDAQPSLLLGRDADDDLLSAARAVGSAV